MKKRLPCRTNKEISLKKTGLFQFTNFLERSIKNWPISRTGYQFQGKFFLERGANLESRAAHTHPKNTQVPPRAETLNFEFPIEVLQAYWQRLMMLFVTNLTRTALLPLYFTYNPRSIFQFFLTFLQINVIKMFTVR